MKHLLISILILASVISCKKRDTEPQEPTSITQEPEPQIKRSLILKSKVYYSDISNSGEEITVKVLNKDSVLFNQSFFLDDTRNSYDTITKIVTGDIKKGFAYKGDVITIAYLLTTNQTKSKWSPMAGLQVELSATEKLTALTPQKQTISVINGSAIATWTVTIP